ncbi:MAG: ABC transporter ATP-binding protein [Lachnospiraceae bacterium]
MHRLELMEVEKKFKDKLAVQNTNISLENGVYGLLGENGAGKTTLMRIICGILKPTNGNVLCDGVEIGQMGKEYRRLLGYLPQSFGYYGDFSALRFMKYMSALKAIPEDYAKNKIDELLELVDLVQVKNQKLKTYSGGMLRRIGIAQALLNEPEILILDEPTSGLDPKERVRFRNVISSLGKNRTVLLSTHIVSDVEYIADRILIMKNGKIVKAGTEKQLSDTVKQIVWKCNVSDEEAQKLNQEFVVSNLRHIDTQIELRIVSDEKPTEDAVAQEAVLEDIYLYFTQNKWKEK